MGLTIHSFFHNYIIHPFSGELSVRDKVKATIASVALAILTLGIAHAICAGLRHRTIRMLENEHRIRATALAQLKLDVYAPEAGVETHALPCGSLSFETVGIQIQDRLITPYYGTRLPPPEEVIVPLPEGGTARWRDLSAERKIEVNNHHTHPHNRVEKTPLGKLMIDRLFMPGGQAPYLPRDPRESHGSDHAVRIAIFTPVFAYLYAKYHPTVTSLSRSEVVLAQFIGAGHDSGRQSEGPDVYDAESAQRTIDALRAVGVDDERVQEQAKAAIAEKDSTDREHKSLIAKLVQNADSAEFARLLLSGPVQYERTFRTSERFLDIVAELEQIAQTSGGRLKGYYLYADFHDELEQIRWEMNRLIFLTHQKEFRAKASMPGKNYYQEVLAVITSEKFPLLSQILETMEVKPPSPEESRHREEAQREETLASITMWLKRGIEHIPTEKLRQFADRLGAIAPTNVGPITKEIEKRERAQEQFSQALSLPKREGAVAVGRAFLDLPPLLREQHRQQLKAYFEYIADLPTGEPSTHILMAAKLHEELCALLEEPSPHDRKAEACHLQELAVHLLETMEALPLDQRDFYMQTTCAVALEKAALIFLEEHQEDQAREVLSTAAHKLCMDPSHPVMQLVSDPTLLRENGRVVSFPTDCQYVRKRRLRACERVLGETHYTELSFELTAYAREALKKTLSLVDPSCVQTVPAEYLRRGKGVNCYVPDKPITIGEDFKIRVTEDIEIYVGADARYWNQYHLMRIHYKGGISLHEVHEALAKIGLPTVLMTPRPEDGRLEAFHRSLAFRFAPLMPSGNPSKDAMVVYRSLSSEQRALVDNDVRCARECLVGPYEIEQVFPNVVREAWEFGARALGSFIWAGDIKATSAVLIRILEQGFLSSKERFQRGILGLGCVPELNFEAGSGNQAFTRILMKDLFEQRYSLDHFPVSGPIFFILDLQALERMPYAYLEDRAGVRNPNFQRTKFLAQKQKPIFHFVGSEMIAQRPTFEEGLIAQQDSCHPLNEVMFDLTLGPQYIRYVVVSRDKDREEVLQALRDAKIYEINGVPIEYCVVASRTIHPALVPGSGEIRPYERERRRELRYV